MRKGTDLQLIFLPTALTMYIICKILTIICVKYSGLPVESNSCLKYYTWQVVYFYFDYTKLDMWIFGGKFLNQSIVIILIFLDIVTALDLEVGLDHLT